VEAVGAKFFSRPSISSSSSYNNIRLSRYGYMSSSQSELKEELGSVEVMGILDFNADSLSRASMNS
jgi:hypothetical protein